MRAMPFPGPAPWTRRVGPPDHLWFADGPPVDEPGARPPPPRRGASRACPRGLHRPFPGPHGGRRARRGDVRAAALLLLAEEPRNGYAIMQAIEERTGGAWRPSPGSVYPALAQLQDEGLVGVEERDGGRTFRLTEAGTAHVEEQRADLERRWRGVEDAVDEGALELMNEMRQLHFAVGQLLSVGTPEQVAEARRVARRVPPHRLPDARGRRGRQRAARPARPDASGRRRLGLVRGDDVLVGHDLGARVVGIPSAAGAGAPSAPGQSDGGRRRPPAGRVNEPVTGAVAIR